MALLAWHISMMSINKSPAKSQYHPINPASLGQLNLVQPAVKQLWYMGLDPLRLLGGPTVAIVGSRAVSSYGRWVTNYIASGLALKGVTIVSGLAIGADSLAHQAAIAAGGHTIAVLPCGIEHVYPSSHQPLAHQILSQKGSLVSEYGPGESANPGRWQFVARNRIIAGLAQAVIITEAAQRSGSLHTAEFALELGIDVFAVPGNINSPTSQGTNKLIRQGAIPVTSLQDILDIIVPNAVPAQELPLPKDQVQAKLLQQIRSGIIYTNELLEKSALPLRQVQQALTMLELSGHIRSLTPGQWSAL